MSTGSPETGNSQLVVSYLILRRAIGYLGIALPFILAVGGCVIFDQHIQESVSYYYHTGMRDTFVGVLCAIGVFLLSYKGYERIDTIAGNLACLFAVGVALFPTSSHPPGSQLEIVIGRIHLGFATLFLSTLAYFSLGLFTRTDVTRQPTPRKLQRNRVYRVCGVLMVACLILIVVFKIFLDQPDSPLARLDPVYWLESIAVFSFGVSWLVKGETILKDHPGS